MVADAEPPCPLALPQFHPCGRDVHEPKLPEEDVVEGVTVMLWELVAVLAGDSESEVVRVTVYVPGEKRWLADCPDPVVPSPKFHE
jgi:hypothetical protein